MAKVTIVQVDLQSQAVINLFQAEAGSLPPAPQGTYYLVPGVDFPAATNVALGMIWDGTRSATLTTFAAPEPIPGDLATLTVDDLVTKLADNATEGSAILNALRQNLGG